jgi:pimeloyl-ACP methyl ester carboxylesterase
MEELAASIISSLSLPRAAAAAGSPEAAEPVFLAGFSMGGYVALEMLRQGAIPDAGQGGGGLVLISSQARADSEVARANRLESMSLAERSGSLDAVLVEQMPRLIGRYAAVPQGEVRRRLELYQPQCGAGGEPDPSDRALRGCLPSGGAAAARRLGLRLALRAEGTQAGSDSAVDGLRAVAPLFRSAGLQIESSSAAGDWAETERLDWARIERCYADDELRFTGQYQAAGDVDAMGAPTGAAAPPWPRLPGDLDAAFCTAATMAREAGVALFLRQQEWAMSRRDNRDTLQAFAARAHAAAVHSVSPAASPPTGPRRLPGLLPPLRLGVLWGKDDALIPRRAHEETVALVGRGFGLHADGGAAPLTRAAFSHHGVSAAGHCTPLECPFPLINGIVRDLMGLHPGQQLQ